VHEQSKAAKRRYNDGAFHSRYFDRKNLRDKGKDQTLTPVVRDRSHPPETLLSSGICVGR
jgi:hypothetical protein